VQFEPAQLRVPPPIGDGICATAVPLQIKPKASSDAANTPRRRSPQPRRRIAVPDRSLGSGIRPGENVSAKGANRFQNRAVAKFLALR